MERIVLDASDDRTKVDLLSKAIEANFELLLWQARNEAAKNDLTEEILEALLVSDN